MEKVIVQSEKPVSPNIVIVGCGPGSPEAITLAGLRAIENAVVVVGAPRLLACFAPPGAVQVPVGKDIGAVLAAIERHLPDGNVVVLVTGDPGISSLARPVLQRFGRRACTVIPGISAIQAAFAGLGLDWLDARLVSAHGRMPEVPMEELARNDKIAVLTGTPAAVQWAARVADALTHHEVYVCRDLTLVEERIELTRADEIRQMPASGRMILIFVKEGLLP
jgi:cobalt-precorrin-7 (C5)-methyltransferase